VSARLLAAVHHDLAQLREADLTLFALATAGFAFALAFCGLAWRAALRGSGRGGLGRRDAISRYGVGSLVNALAPAGIGGGVRLALFGRAAGGTGTACAMAATAAARIACLAPVAVIGLGPGVLPLRSAPSAAVALAAVGAAAVFRRRLGSLRVAGWIALGTCARLAAAAAVVAAVGIPHPLALAPAALAAIELAGTVPLTPGNVGVGAGAVSLALSLYGVRSGTGIAAGMLFQLADTAASIAVGGAGLGFLARGYVRRKLGSSLSAPDEKRPPAALSLEKLGTIVRRRPPPPSPVATTVTQT